MLLTLHCEESTRIQSEGLDRDLSAVERWAVRLHSLSCKVCRRFRKQLEFVNDAGKRRANQPVSRLAKDRRDQIARRIRETNP